MSAAKVIDLWAWRSGRKPKDPAVAIAAHAARLAGLAKAFEEEIEQQTVTVRRLQAALAKFLQKEARHVR